jgi:threonyl-tRNA synthetase
VDSEHERALGQDALASTPLALVLCEKTELERELISCLQSVQKTINILKFKGSYSLFLPSSKSGQCAFERDALLQLMEKLGLVGVEVHEATGRALRIEARVEDALGLRWPFSYVELDPPLAKAFGLHQKAGLGKMTKLNAIVWRLFPSVEALIALLLEREEGPWELEIAPEQLRVIPKESAQVDYAATVLQDLRERGLRATLDARDIPFKQRMYQSTRDWVPYVLLLGPPERATETLSMRSFTGEVTKELDLDTFVARMRDSGWCRSISEGRLRGDKNEDAN